MSSARRPSTSCGSDPDENPTSRGGTLYAGYDQQNTGRVLIAVADPLRGAAVPEARRRRPLAGVTAGPLDLQHVRRLQDRWRPRSARGRQRAGARDDSAAARQRAVRGDVQRREPRPQRPQLTSSPRLAAGIVNNLRSPDIVALEEIQDNNGPINDGTVAADQTLTSSRRRSWRPAARRTNGARSTRSTSQTAASPAATSGSASSSTRRGSAFIDRPGGDATTAVDVVAGPGGEATADGLARPDRPDEQRLEEQPQAAGRGVPLQRQDASSWWPTTSTPRAATSP